MADLEYAPFVTVYRTLKGRYRAAVMEWDSFQEVYEPSRSYRQGSAKSKMAAMQDAAALAKIYNLEIKE